MMAMVVKIAQNQMSMNASLVHAQSMQSAQIHLAVLNALADKDMKELAIVVILQYQK
jgi:hypothetical protein